MKDEHKLNESLTTSFIDKTHNSNENLRSELLRNSPEDNEKVIPHLKRALENCDEFFFSIAFITDGGIALLLNTLKSLEERNIPGHILTSNYLFFNNPKTFHRLKSFRNLELRVYDCGDFHTKCYMFKKGELYDFIIGSSNLTQGALTTNAEWNLKVSASPKGELSQSLFTEFQRVWNKAQKLNDEWIANYAKEFKKRQALREKHELEASKLNAENKQLITPNHMQAEALDRLAELRIAGKKRALLISATGTGKTYLSAFDVKQFKPRRMLFIVHREQIAKNALKSFQRVIDNQSINYGIISGEHHDYDADYIFTTIQSISRDRILEHFTPNHFDYIVVDEVHHAKASSYAKVLNYFQAKFTLGMTATPERSDGQNIYELFDYNIAYEIRLQKALESNMLCPFHYFGVSDIKINGQLLDDKASFSYLTSDERIRNIIKNINFYGYSGDRVKGLIFCSRIDEAKELSQRFNELGYRTTVLTGDNSQEERQSAAKRLQQDDPNNALDYIFTVDIFNEGIDIPEINQIIMLRPTQSAIIFVQQLGRGLRKAHNKDFVIVIDFIGNYENNFLIPIALSGDRTMNKDTLRKYVIEGISTLPGSSTISFDKISEQRIFESISRSRFTQFDFLKQEYLDLRNKINRTPMLCDFYNYGSIDPQIILQGNIAKGKNGRIACRWDSSYYNFLNYFYERKDEEWPEELPRLTMKQIKALDFISRDLCNGMRPHELIIINELLNRDSIPIQDIKIALHNYNIDNTATETDAAIRVLNNSFYGDVAKTSKFKIADYDDDHQNINISLLFKEILDNNLKFYIKDSINYALKRYEEGYAKRYRGLNFQLFEKYNRANIFRLLNYTKDKTSYPKGYIFAEGFCPIFVTLNKAKDTSSATNYADYFIDKDSFAWQSTNGATKEGADWNNFMNYKKNNTRFLLFVKKNDSEGVFPFYFLGEVIPKLETIQEASILDEKSGKQKPLFNLEFQLLDPVRDDIYDYLAK